MSDHVCEMCLDVTPIKDTVLFVSSEKDIRARMCRPCGKYWISQAAVVLHND